VLDVGTETGQADDVSGRFVLLASLGLAVLACKKPSAPEQVADQFVDAYFAHADQERAKGFTALGATKMMDEELKEVGPVRKGGYGPNEAGANVTYKRGQPTMREQRVRVPYEIIAHAENQDVIRDADIELAEIQGSWKVVRVGLTSR